MKIFVYTIESKEGDYTISQVYAKGIFRGFMALQLVTGCLDSQIEYINEETTTNPLQYDDIDTVLIRSN